LVPSGPLGGEVSDLTGEGRLGRHCHLVRGQEHSCLEGDNESTRGVSPMKKTMLVDVVFVNNVMWAERGKGVKGAKAMGGQLLPDKGPGWMGIHHPEQEAGSPSKWGFLYCFCKGAINCLYICE
jgi:hypothetical protein